MRLFRERLQHVSTWSVLSTVTQLADAPRVGDGGIHSECALVLGECTLKLLFAPPTSAPLWMYAVGATDGGLRRPASSSSSTDPIIRTRGAHGAHDDQPILVAASKQHDEGISTLPSAGLLAEHSTDDAYAAYGTAQMAHTSLAKSSGHWLGLTSGFNG